MPDATATLLVVDDTEMNRDMLSRRLAKQGYAVLVAEDGQAAIETVERQAVDLVLLDIMMPGIDGIEVLERLRKTHSPSELPVIMVTAKDESADVVAALKKGANDYVTKPIDFAVVLARTRTQLALKHAQQALTQKIAEVERLAADLEVRNTFIRKVFGRYLTDEVAESLLASPEALDLGGQRRKVTILMSDLRGFSPMSERHAPEQVVKVLNRYLGAMADVICQYHGTIDEFIGDAILAIFGAPTRADDDAERAVACALAMQAALAGVNDANRQDGLPLLEMGIGIHTGEAIVGNIGSERRAKYGVVGSAVNLAGRLESYTVGGQVLVSAATATEMPGLLRVARRLQMTAKGLREPVSVLEVTGIGGRHQIFLDAPKDESTTLAEPLPAECLELQGKHAEGSVFHARVTRVSKRCAHLTGDHVPPLHSNLRIEFPTILGASGEHLYAKVIAADGDTFTVLFTFVPPPLVSALDRLASSRVPGETK